MNKIFEIRTMINNNLYSMKEYAQSAYLYFKNHEFINESDEIKWGLLALIDYIDIVNDLANEYELEYERKIEETIGKENINRNITKLFQLELGLSRSLNKIKEYAEDGYECYINSNYISKFKLLEELEFIQKNIDVIEKILDEIMVTYEKELEEKNEQL